MDGLQAAFAEYVQTFFLGYFGVDASSYDQEHLKLTKSGPDTGVLNFHPVALNSFHFLMPATIQMKWHDCINSILCFRWSSMVVPSVHRSCILPGRTFEEQHSLPWRRWEVSNTSKTVVLSQELHARNKLKAYASYDCGDVVLQVSPRPMRKRIWKWDVSRSGHHESLLRRVWNHWYSPKPPSRE